MSDLGLSMIDETVNETNHWLNLLGDRLGLDHQRAYHALRAGLHTLRDRLPIAEAAALGAQLPHLVRGVYYDGWRPADVPETTRSVAQYAEALRGRLVDGNGPDAEATARAVFWLLDHNCGSGIMEKIRNALPGDVAEELFDRA